MKGKNLVRTGRRSAGLTVLRPEDQLMIERSKKRVHVFGAEGRVPWLDFPTPNEAYEKIFGKEEITPQRALEVIRALGLEMEIYDHGDDFIVLSYERQYRLAN
ncbi:MAG TPA: hypothetical protein VMD74_03830 [Candidatus Methylomirabilis sp.]|nr:hypothetical protein [Candidatus Methylomirabilis sp.]